MRAPEKKGVRQRRANGDESRERILDATMAIAGERGYEGTSIALVSGRSGLPASSIYWHFEDKEALFAAAIQWGYERLEAQDLWASKKLHGTVRARLTAIVRNTVVGLQSSPDIVRLAIMLLLGRRPEELAARRICVKRRQLIQKRSEAVFERIFPNLSACALAHLAQMGTALAEGIFVTLQVEGASAPLAGHYETAAAALEGAAEQLSQPARSLKAAEREE